MFDLEKLKTSYRYQKYACKTRKDRLGNPIHFNLTFDEWLQIWIDSGKLHLRGNYKHQYCMARKDDIGHYEIGNVGIVTNYENNSTVDRSYINTTVVRKAMSDACKSKPRAGCIHCGNEYYVHNLTKHIRKCNNEPGFPGIYKEIRYV